MLSIEEFRQLLFEAGTDCGKEWESEIVDLENAGHRVASADLISPLDIPPASNSAMDGYALFCEKTLPSGTQLPVSQTVTAGQFPQPLENGTCARIFTGAEIPEGANTVIIQENVTKQEDIDDHKIVTTNITAEGENIRRKGQDIPKNTQILSRGDFLDAAKLGILASCGIPKVEVFTKPKVALIASGNELVSPGAPLKPGQIYNSNQIMLKALLENFGCEIVQTVHLPDSFEKSLEVLGDAAQNAHMVVSSGGVSVGDEDHIKSAVQTLGEIQQWKVLMKPGKPLVFASLRHSPNPTPFFGLPGNPVSSFITACIFIRAFLQAAFGRTYTPLRGYPLAADFEVPVPQTRAEFRRCILVDGKISMLHNQSSGALSSVDNCEGLAFIPANSTVALNDTLEFFPKQHLMAL